MSEQDFFFDEEEQEVAEKPAAKKTDSPSGTAGSSKPVAAAATSAQGVSMTIASLIGVVALLAGVIIGIVLPVGAGTDVPAPSTTTGTESQAPQLTPEQLESGQMPPGHPQVGAPSGTATGSAPTTP